MLAEDADDYSVSRSLEAYLLWLFGWMMFNNSHGQAADKILLGYAREIADAAAGEVPRWSWGSAVLAATYRGLCEASQRTERGSILTGCPLLLQLWSYERLAVGRPLLDHSPYDSDLYGDGDDGDDAPTMGTLWCGRQVRVSI
jgi:hypothetical protein